MFRVLQLLNEELRNVMAQVGCHNLGMITYVVRCVLGGTHTSITVGHWHAE